jgi:excinuclease ABC subunit B
MDFFPKEFLTVIDESHVTVPQVRGMHGGDRARKENLVEYGFRLPAALDNRPLKFHEFTNITNKVIYVSATPADYELGVSNGEIVEQLIRPTFVVDPALNVRDTKHQIDDIIDTLNGVIRGGNKALVTTITKAMSEEMSRYLSNVGIQNAYLHSDIDTLDRVKILDDLREDRIDVIVGVNLLREGIDLPDVSLAIILDADKQGFLRDVRSITQISGRAARNEKGLAILYGATITDTMRMALIESNRRRSKQVMFNFENNCFPRNARRSGTNQSHLIASTAEEETRYDNIDNTNNGIVAEELIAYSTNGTSTIERSIEKLIEEARAEMETAAKNLDFMAATKHRDRMYELQKLREQEKLGDMYDTVRKAK